MKLLVPMDVLIEQMSVPLPAVFVRFLGAAEVVGALGLILPRLLRIRASRTLLAAAGLVIIMIGAVMFTPPEDLTLTAVPILVGIIVGFVACGRWRCGAAGKRPVSPVWAPARHVSAPWTEGYED